VARGWVDGPDACRNGSPVGACEACEAVIGMTLEMVAVLKILAGHQYNRPNTTWPPPPTCTQVCYTPLWVETVG
jgi:hypothetical protein